MPMFVPTPRNDEVIRQFGPYPGGLNLLDRKATAVQRAIRRGGLAQYEPETHATLLSLVQLSPKPAVFFDVGAHIGLYSTVVSTVFPRDIVRAIAFEPAPDTAALARKLADKNHAAVQVEQLAIGADDGTATLYISDKAETSNSLVAGFRPSSETVEVERTSVDNYCTRNGILPTVMKIDVETYETFVLRGARNTFIDARPAVVCELLPRADPENSRAALLELVEIGYHIHQWVRDEGWIPCDVDEIAERTSQDIRDWLFTPTPLTDQFHAVMSTWTSAIAKCTVEQNVLTGAGEVPPPGWGAPHRRPHLSS